MKKWIIFLVLGVLLIAYGIWYYINTNNFVVSFFFGFLFFCLTYSIYNFSKGKVVRIGKKLTILFSILFIIALIIGFSKLAGELLFVGFVFLIYWYFENKKILKL